MKVYPHPKITDCLVVEIGNKYTLIHNPNKHIISFENNECYINGYKAPYKDKKTSDLFDKINSK